MTAAPLLQVRALDTYYGAAHILHGISLEVAPGETAALIGRNGAGKTTTLKAIMGLVAPARGSVRFAGTEIAGLPPYRVARLGLGYVPEDRRIFTDLTVAENLQVAERPARSGREPWTVERLFALFPNLANAATRRADRISGGEQQMLTVARTLMGNPSMILLDEPSEGLAPVVVEQMAGAMRALKDEGISMLLSEQNLRIAGAIAERAYVLESGVVTYSGAMQDLVGSDELRRTHLGL